MTAVSRGWATALSPPPLDKGAVSRGRCRCWAGVKSATNPRAGDAGGTQDEHSCQGGDTSLPEGAGLLLLCRVRGRVGGGAEDGSPAWPGMAGLHVFGFCCGFSRSQASSRRSPLPGALLELPSLARLGVH